MPRKISFVPNTSTGENLVVKGLDIPTSGGNVVTDALPFERALLHLRVTDLHIRGEIGEVLAGKIVG